MANIHHPHHPIVYVRGFAMLQSEIDDTVADPYMGFNIGATKSRMLWTGEIKKFFFESPLVRLMREENGDYDDVYIDGDDIIMSDSAQPVPYQCLVIYRYYDTASTDFGDKNKPHPIEEFAKGLSRLIDRLRQRVCANPGNSVAENDFRCYLVAHSMGGLVCRAFLQNPKLDPQGTAHCVDKLFTYATPHNGIDLRIVRNVPAWAAFGDANNFNRDRMAQYLALPTGTTDVSEVRNFPADRIFNLVGTNPTDYLVARGLSSWAVGEVSDGLVRLENATTHGKDARGNDVNSPRAFVYRSHSGNYGIVNSEEGFQNLTRFLFGKLRVDGFLDIEQIYLPPEVQQQRDAGKHIAASYQIEIVVSVRGAQWQVHRRTVRENSAIFRKFDELFPTKKDGVWSADGGRTPQLFSIFLDPSKSTQRKPGEAEGPVSFALDLAVQVPDYAIDGVLFLKQHYEGGYLYRKQIVIEAFPDSSQFGGWRVNWGVQDTTPNKAPTPAPAQLLPDHSGVSFAIDASQNSQPGIKGSLRIEARKWNE